MANPVRRPAPARLHWFNPGKIAEHTQIDALARVASLARGTVIDVGCGRQPYRHLFPHVEAYVGVELLSAPDDAPVSVFGDAQALPFLGAVADTIVCVQVFQYVWDHSRLFQEFARILRPKGWLIMITNQADRENTPPYDLFRVTRFGLARLAEHAGLEVEEVSARGGFWRMVGYETSLYLLNNFGGLKVAGRPLIAVGCAVVQLTCAMLDRLHCDPADTLGHLLVARKPAP